MKTACKKKLLHSLLILAIGLMPVAVLSMDDMHHMNPLSAGSTDCEQMAMATDPSCDHESCVSMGHVCGANSATGFITESLLGDINPLPETVKHSQGDIRYRLRLKDSIYRPPIA